MSRYLKIENGFVIDTIMGGDSEVAADLVLQTPALMSVGIGWLAHEDGTFTPSPDAYQPVIAIPDPEEPAPDQPDQET